MGRTVRTGTTIQAKYLTWAGKISVEIKWVWPQGGVISNIAILALEGRNTRVNIATMGYMRWRLGREPSQAQYLRGDRWSRPQFLRGPRQLTSRLNSYSELFLCCIYLLL